MDEAALEAEKQRLLTAAAERGLIIGYNDIQVGGGDIAGGFIICGMNADEWLSLMAAQLR